MVVRLFLAGWLAVGLLFVVSFGWLLFLGWLLSEEPLCEEESCCCSSSYSPSWSRWKMSSSRVESSSSEVQ